MLEVVDGRAGGMAGEEMQPERCYRGAFISLNQYYPRAFTQFKRDSIKSMDGLQSITASKNAQSSLALLNFSPCNCLLNTSEAVKRIGICTQRKRRNVFENFI